MNVIIFWSQIDEQGREYRKIFPTLAPSFGRYLRLRSHDFQWWIPSGKRLHSYGKIHHAINGKIHYFYGHFQ